MNVDINAILSFLSSHSGFLLKLTCILFLGLFVVVRHLESFEVEVGAKTRIRGTSRKISGLSSWRQFLQLILCMLVYTALALVILLIH
jgi:hypothetical protein